MCTIYEITNIVNGKCYIGQTWNKDLQKYFRNSHRFVKGRTKLYNAILKYGSDNFKIESILVVDTQLEADKQEVFFISQYNSVQNGYNLRSGGSHGRHSEESKRKISEAGKGRKHSEESKKKISASHIGKKLSTSTKRKMSKAKLGKHVSVATEFKKGHTKNRKFSPQQEKDIALAYDAYKSSYKVAKIFGCSNATILNIINRQSDIFQQFPGNINELHKNNTDTSE